MWKLKVLVQFILAHIPFGEALNHRLQLANSLQDEIKLRMRVKSIGEGLKRLRSVTPITGKIIVEMGTGWDALPTLMLFAAGAKRIYSYDHLPHLRLDLMRAAARTILSDADLLSDCLGCSVKVVRERLSRALSTGEDNLSRFLDCTNILYKAPGDASATRLPEHSVDIFYSNTVLQHVPEGVANAIVKEAKRVLKADGVYYATMWLSDMYSGFDSKVSPVNFLKYPEWLWAFFVKNKISYTNRLRERDFVDIMRSHQANVFKITSILDPENVQRVKSMKIDKRFAEYSAEELAVTFTEIIAGWPKIG